MSEVVNDHEDIAVGTEGSVAGTGDAAGFCPVFYEEGDLAEARV